MAAIKALQQWCRQQCEGYPEVNITNMTTSFRDGLAFCAILHRHRPDLIDFSTLRKENIYENNKLAFQVAEEQLGIPALLDAEDMVALKVPDRLSILTYVSQYYNYFHGRSPIGGMAGVKRPSSDLSEGPVGKKVISQPVKPASPAPAQPLSPVRTNPIVQGKSTGTEFPPAKPGRVSLGIESPQGSRSSICAICKKHVHLVQRHLVDGKLYHRNCFRCKQCSNTLHSGAYKSTGEPGVFVCTDHHTRPSTPNSKSPSTDRKQPAAGYPSRTNPVPMDTTSPGVSWRAQELDKPKETGQKTNQPGRQPVSNSTPKGFVQSSGWSPSSVGNSATNSLSPINPALQKSTSSTNTPSNSFLNRFTQNSSPDRGKPSGVTNNSPVGWSSAQRKSDPPTTPALSKLDSHTTSPQGKLSFSVTPQSPRTSPLSKSDPPAATQNITSRIKSDFRAAPQNQLNSYTAASQHKADSSSNSWTSLASKTQQAREKFFQSSGASADKPPASKVYGLTFTSSQAAGKTSSGVTTAPGQSTQDSTKDKARDFLVKNLMKGPGFASNGQLSTTAQGPSRSSPTPSRVLTPDPKAEGPRGAPRTKLEPASSQPGVVTALSSQSKVSAPASPQRARKSPAFSRPGGELTNTRQKADTSVVADKGPSSVENQDGPAGWRSKLKPVEKISSVDKVPELKQKVALIETKGLAIPKKPLENSLGGIRITLSPVLKDKTPASASSFSSNSQGPLPGPTSRKKLLIPPNLDVSDNWMKPEQKWEESIPPEKPSRLNKPERPCNPPSFSISPKKEVKSPVKLHPDYMSEEEIQKKIQDIEKELDLLELKGIDLERKLREAEGDDSEDALMVEWFKLIHEKQLLLRQESELMYKAKEQRLEEMQLDIADELRRLLEKSEELKTPKEKKREQELLEQYVNTVNDRSDIVDCLDEDRIREQEEDQVIQDMIQKLDLQKDGAEKKKTKSRLSKIWKPKNKGKTSA
ncbi:MICAL-like protein 2 isoform X2 [Phascolarctos cinereus]|uniref:MICAL-like protein 2 isoform X2 n=1 Tax=Phascolarctos cinereus TaxID=38626 RepID=A0A6P5JLZ3_PHACI|nr:MICAL-like protein 2 isoform X2 [Phascolarctos cinereus]